MLIIGLTGGIGSGKTTVADMFAELGVDIIDTDIIARDLVQPDKPAFKKITEHFGHHIVDSDGQLNRQKLSEVTFNNEKERKALESILHPSIEKEMLMQISKINKPYCIAVIPLLFETGQQQRVDRILVVDCETDDQLQRVQNRDNRSTQQILSIINAQVSRNTRLSAADDIIENSGDMKNLHNKVDKLHKKYLELRG